MTSTKPVNPPKVTPDPYDPEYYKQTEDHTACGGVRADLRRCLELSDCVQIDRKTGKQCLKERSPNVPDQCYQLAQLMFDCKRSLLDTRQRFRGRKGY